MSLKEPFQFLVTAVGVSVTETKGIQPPDFWKALSRSRSKIRRYHNSWVSVFFQFPEAGRKFLTACLSGLSHSHTEIYEVESPGLTHSFSLTDAAPSLNM